MALLDELKKYFPLIGQSFSKKETVEIVSLSVKAKALRTGDLPPFLPGLYRPIDFGFYNNAGGLSRHEDDGYVEFIYDGTSWTKNNTPIPDLSNRIVQYSFSKYDIEVDVNGYCGRYYNIAEKEEDVPSLYYLYADADGFVGSFFRISDIESTNNLGSLPRLKDSFSDETEVTKDSMHIAFPGLCIGKTGVLHSFYRKGLHHTGIDGNIMYKFSKDFGTTWSEEEVFLQGGELQPDGSYSDFRDSKAIRMSNGKFLYSVFKGYAEENGGTPPYHVDYLKEKYEALSVILEENPDGSINLASKEIIIMPTPDDAIAIATGGGLMEKDEIIYHTVYSGNTNNDAYLLKSQDFGTTWEVASKIDFNHNESSIAFLGETLYCLLRAQNGNAKIRKSLDYGATWIDVKFLDTYWHGHYLRGLGDSILVSGRAYNGKTTIMFFDRNGNALLDIIQFGNGLDGAYSQSYPFENYIYLTYSTQKAPDEYGLYVRKIERNKVLGLSY